MACQPSWCTPAGSKGNHEGQHVVMLVMSGGLASRRAKECQFRTSQRKATFECIFSATFVCTNCTSSPPQAAHLVVVNDAPEVWIIISFLDSVVELVSLDSMVRSGHRTSIVRGRLICCDVLQIVSKHCIRALHNRTALL